MTERLSNDIFDENHKIIIEQIEKAAVVSGRNAKDITLLAATKTVDIDTINHAISSGIGYIGENRVQEFLQKKDFYMPVHKHFIGHLQTNKVKDILPHVELIHSVDSVHLAKEISKTALKLGITARILLEVNIGNEESKSGFGAEEVIEKAFEISEMPSLEIRGLMAIPPVCENAQDNVKYFDKMNKLFIDIKDKKIDNSNIDTLSMGMSDDYVKAIESGATLVRIGTALFGKRVYK